MAEDEELWWGVLLILRWWGVEGCEGFEMERGGRVRDVVFVWEEGGSRLWLKSERVCFNCGECFGGGRRGGLKGLVGILVEVEGGGGSGLSGFDYVGTRGLRNKNVRLIRSPLVCCVNRNSTTKSSGLLLNSYGKNRYSGGKCERREAKREID